jgi:phosphatidylglycerol:prolipoprotein diacylglycerol transferase
MMPTVFRIPGINLDIPGFGLMLMVAFLLSIWWAARRAHKSGGNPDVILNCGFIAVFAGVVGCRAMHVVHYWEEFANEGSLWNTFLAVIDIRRGGVEFYGGFVFTIVCVLAWLKFYEKVSLRWYMDIIAPSAALGLAIGRIGCFLNGCCYGTTSELPWAVQFPLGSPASTEQWRHRVPGAGLPQELLLTTVEGVSTPLQRESAAASPAQVEAAAKAEQSARDSYSLLLSKAQSATGDARAKLDKQVAAAKATLDSAERHLSDIRRNMRKYESSAAAILALAKKHGAVPVHPTQLYSTITALIVAFLLNAWYYRRSRDGQVIFGLLLIEPVTRYLLELIRADNPIDTAGQTISQSIAIGLTLIGLIGLIVLRTMSPRSPNATRWTPPDSSATTKPTRGKVAVAT